MTNAQQPFDVFLAHNSQDKPQVKEIAQKLKRRGLNPWLDEYEIQPGKLFVEEIQKSILQVKAVAIFFGSKGLGNWQSFEMQMSIILNLKKKINVIPVLLPGVSKLPENQILLEGFNWVIFSTIDDAHALKLLEWGITGEKSTLLSNSDEKPENDLSSIFQMFGLNIAKYTVKSLLNNWLINFLVEKFLLDKQQSNKEITEIKDEQIAEEIIEQEIVTETIQDILKQNNDDSGSELQIGHVLSEIKRLLKQLLIFLISSAQKRLDETNNEAEKDVNQLANQIEKFPKDEIDKKLDEIVDVRRREIVDARRREPKPVIPLITDEIPSSNSQQTDEFESLGTPYEKPSLENPESKKMLENLDKPMLEMFVLNIATSVVKQVLPRVLPRLINYVLEIFINDRQPEDTETTAVKEEEIIEEITKEEFIIKVIKELLQQRIDDFGYNQEQVMPKVLGEIQILLKQFLDFLISSSQTKLSEDNIETDEGFVELKKQLETRNQLETMEAEKKIDEFVAARRTELEVENQPQQPIARSSQPEQPVLDENQDPLIKTKPHDSSEDVHQGWLAIDFGTSNSTVTVFDQKEVRDPNQELPKQQRERLSQLFKDWLGSQPLKAPDGVKNNEWEKFFQEVDKNLGLARKGNLKQIQSNETSSYFLELTRQIELCLSNQWQDSLRKEVSKKLNNIYHEVFQIPPLEDESLLLVELDSGRPNEYQIISELEITNSGNPLKVEMGSLVSQNRLEAISKAETENEFKEIKTKFHPSPKRYLIAIDPAEYIDVYLNGQHNTIFVKHLVQAAWQHLIELTETYKDKKPEKFQKGRFKRAIVTYPTVSSPAVRREIEDLVKQLGFTDVKTIYDEAIAAAIFYLWREFSGNKTIGLEAFKTRCRRSGDKWAQNVLVLDIGGGTTDLALIRLVLEEKNPFDPGEDRGAGGRYYVLTPDLKGSSGHLGLGGELITLRVFWLLKVAIADRILTAVAEGKLQNSKLEGILNSVDQSFKSEDNKFRSGALLESVNKKYANKENDTHYKLALDIAEDVLPTRWVKPGSSSKSLQTFYTLWDEAEKAKLKLGKGTEDFELDGKNVKQLLSQNFNDLPNEFDDLGIKLEKNQFEQVASQDIEKAIGIAKGLLESRLPIDESTNKKEPLDWLILSGQTCKLDLVRRKLKEIFRDSEEIDLDRTRITFVDEYAKLATSMGACYAERLQQYLYNFKAAKPKLREGYSEIEIRVKNLLNTLPCTFVRKNQDDAKYDDNIFEPGQSLYQFDQDDVAKARSKWLELQPTNTIYRQDYNNAPKITWANFFFEEKAKELGVSSEIKKYLVQFEINQKLEISLLICKGKPHYLIDSRCPSLNVQKKISDAVKTPNKPEENIQITNDSEEVQTSTEQLYPETMISEDGKLQWEIVVGVQEKLQHSVFKAGKILDNNFEYSDNSQEKPRKGLLSEEQLPRFPEGGKHTFYAYYPSKDNLKGKLLFIGELEPPNGQLKEDFPYYVTIDDQGWLRIHEGEYFYKLTSDKLENLKKEGCVVRIEPTPIGATRYEESNPFSGIH